MSLEIDLRIVYELLSLESLYETFSVTNGEILECIELHRGTLLCSVDDVAFATH
jgi:hypothetical protein